MFCESLNFVNNVQSISLNRQSGHFLSEYIGNFVNIKDRLISKIT